MNSAMIPKNQSKRMVRGILYPCALAGLILSGFFFIRYAYPAPSASMGGLSPSSLAPPEGSWIYTFNVPGILEETASEKESSSPYFWLSSGGKLMIADGVGRT